MKFSVSMILIFLNCAVFAELPFDLCFYHSNNGDEYIQCGSLLAYKNQNNKKMEEIEKVYIGWNTSMPNLVYGLFSSFTKLKALQLNNAQINYVDKRAFYNMEQLKELSLFNNNISEIDSTVFKYLHYLKILDLGTNKFTKLEDFIFHNLKYLEELTLSWNKLQVITKDTFYGLENLSKLNLGGNSLKLIDADTFAYLTYLISLDLSYNNIDELPLTIFANQTNLETLHLESNNLHELKLGLFDTTTELRHLDVSNNFIKQINGSLLRNTIVEILKFERNLVSDVNVSELLQQAQFLEELYFNYNPWSCNSLRYVVQYLEESQIHVEPGTNFTEPHINGILCY